MAITKAYISLICVSFTVFVFSIAYLLTQILYVESNDAIFVAKMGITIIMLWIFTLCKVIFILNEK